MKKKNMLTNFKIMFNNMRGYKMKKETLTHIINEERPVVLGIAETNLEKEEVIEKIEGYVVKRKDRKKKGGGVMLIYREALENMVIEDEEDLGEDEILWMTIKNQNIKIKIGVVYMPQENAKAAELKRLYNRVGKGVEKATMEQARVILMGDFNAKIGDGGEDEASKGGEMLMEMARKQDLYSQHR